MQEDNKITFYGISIKAVIFNEEGKLLTMFRTETAPNRPNTWDLPGGDLESEEEPIDSIIREIKEETGLEVKDVNIFDAGTYVVEKGMEWATLCYKCKAIGDKVTLSYEHNDYRWVTQEEFLKLESSPKLQRFVRNTIKI